MGGDALPRDEAGDHEYNWGGLESVNSALAEADVLGIFGREGLHLAALWSPLAATDPGAFAFRLCCNVDGAGGRFGNTGVRATSGGPGRVAIYAALRGDGRMIVTLVNKSTSDETSALSVFNFAPSGAGSLLPLVVGHDDAHEGSCGRSGSGAERPAAGPGGACWYPQAIEVCP